MSDLDYRTYNLDDFKCLGIKGNIKNIHVEAISEKKYEGGIDGAGGIMCKILLKDKTAEMWMTMWREKANLGFMSGDTISISQVESTMNKHFETWEIKKCKASKIINHRMQRDNPPEVQEALDIADSISSEANPPAKTQTVQMPFNPEAIESIHIFHPELDQPQLRKMHATEPDILKRNHIEMVILFKRLMNITSRVGDILEGMKK